MYLEFPYKGLTIYVPNSISDVTIKILPKPSPWEDEEYLENQFLISYQIVHPDYSKTKPFPEPIIFEAKFTEKQLNCVDTFRDLYLAFNIDRKWIIKDQSFGDTLNDGIWRGSKLVHLTHPGDPMVAWGP